MHAFHLRFFEQTDLPAVSKLLAEYQSEIFDKTDLAVFHEELVGFLAQPIRHTYFVYVLEKDEQVIGVIILKLQADSKWYFEICCLAIAKNLRGKKLGQLLLQETIPQIKKHGAAHVFLKTSGAAYNQATEHFYQKMGFQKLAMLPSYYIDEVPHRHKIVENCELFYKQI